MTAGTSLVTFDSLPIELKLDIIEILYYDTKIPHIMTPNAAWARPYYHITTSQDPQSRPQMTIPKLVGDMESMNIVDSTSHHATPSARSITPLKDLRL